MADDFDSFLSSALAPPERLPDRAFVRRVQAGIAIEKLLAAERRMLVAGFMKQLLALAAVAAGVRWLSSAGPIAGWIAESPAAGLAILFISFGLFVALLATRAGPATTASSPF